MRRKRKYRINRFRVIQNLIAALIAAMGIIITNAMNDGTALPIMLLLALSMFMSKKEFVNTVE